MRSLISRLLPGREPPYIREYKKYRRIGRDLCTKMSDFFLDEATLKKAGKQLGMYRRHKGKNVMMFDSEEDANVLMDHLLFNILKGGKNAVQIYMEKVGPENETEEKLLNAMALAHLSLFRVKSKSMRKCTVILEDLLHGGEITLVDIALSYTAIQGFLLFLRVMPLPIDDLHMASGFAFIFKEEPDFLIERYERMKRGIKADCEDGRLFIAFYRLYNKLSRGNVEITHMGIG